MPLIIFNVNTKYSSNARALPLSMEADGSFKMTKRLEYVPPPETVFYLRHVSFDGSGDNAGQGGRNKSPTYTLEFRVPQMEEDIISSNSSSKTIVNRTDNDGNLLPLTVNNYGVLRFPLLSFPASGSASGTKANRVERQANNSIAQGYQHRANHDMNLRLGRMKLEGGFLECILTPRDSNGRLATDRSGADRTCRIRKMQVILEYS